MQTKRFVFAGNRSFVLRKMQEYGLAVTAIFAVPGSYLARELEAEGTSFQRIEDKNGFVEALDRMDFDVFVSNGCPVILPVSRLGAEHKRTFVNVHPSFLPDLKGRDPVPGALLLGRDSGATCHLMDDGIDTGPIIAQVRIPNTPCLDVGLLYQLSFMAEQDVFEQALAADFQPPAAAPPAIEPPAHYSRKDADRWLDFAEAPEAMARRIKAFGNRNQGALFRHRGHDFRVFDCEIVRNPYLLDRLSLYQQGQIIFNYEGRLLFRYRNIYMKFTQIDGPLELCRPGEVLGADQEPAGPGR